MEMLSTHNILCRKFAAVCQNILFLTQDAADMYAERNIIVKSLTIAESKSVHYLYYHCKIYVKPPNKNYTKVN